MSVGPAIDALPIEVLMDDGSWVRAELLKAGAGDADEVGGDGWAYCRERDLHWWAAPGEWRRSVSAALAVEGER